MRIGLVVPGFSADEGDWCIPALRYLVGRLAKEDEVRVLALRYPHRAARYELFGAEVLALGGGAGRGRHSVGLWGRALAALAAEHARRRFDLLHAFWANETGALAALAGRLLRIPCVVSLAGGELVGLRDLGYGGQLARTERIKVRLALLLASAVAVGSKELLERAAARLPSGGAGRLHRAPLGVEVATFRPGAPAPADAPLRLVHVASLVPVKDQATLLQAAARLMDVGAFDADCPGEGPVSGTPYHRGDTESTEMAPCTPCLRGRLREGHRIRPRAPGGYPARRWVLEIVGSGPLEPDLRALATRLGLEEMVSLRGYVPHDHLPPVYSGGAAFVLSSRHEAQGMALLEAAACGVPAVATRVGVAPELAPEAASVVPVVDPAALAEAIAGLLADPARRRAMGEAARARVEAEFSLERSVERFRELYSALA